MQALDNEMDWSNMLSLGERQRLGFGRVLLYRPKYVILDESTSAMDMASERRMYELLCTARSLDGGSISYISVGHRPSLAEYHHTRLTLSGDTYTIESIQPSQATS